MWLGFLRSDQGGSFGQRLLVGVGAAAFFCVCLPLLFSLTSNSTAFVNSQSFTDYRSFAQAGMLFCGISMVVLSAALSPPTHLKRSVVFSGTAGCVLAAITLVLTLFFSLPLPIVRIAGFLFGICMNVAFLTWCLIIKNAAMEKLLFNISLCCIVSVLFNYFLSLLAKPVAGVVFLLALVIGLLPLVLTTTHAPLKFPQYDKSPDLDSADISLVQNSSLSSMFFVLFTTVAGLVLFVVLSNAQVATWFDIGVTATSIGITCSAFLVAFFSKLIKKPLLPFTHQVLFPAIAAFLIIMDSFVVGTAMFMLGSAGVFFFFSIVAVFAIAFLVAVIDKGEFAALLVVGISASLCSSAAVLSTYFTNSMPDYNTRGSFLLVICTCYFVLILILPVLRQWRERRNDMQDSLSHASERKNLEDYCEIVSEKIGCLREKEKFLYT